MKSLTAILAPPLLCAGVLVGIAAEKTTHVRAADAEAYHANVKSAIAAMRHTVGKGGEEGLWIGEDVPPTKAAVELLRPNIILSRKYIDTHTANRTTGTGREGRRCDLLIVQCWDSRDMVGHYPENCYVNAGDTLIDKRPRDWEVGEWTITGTEYTFEQFRDGQPQRRSVYNFLVVPVTPDGPGATPGIAIVRDIKELNRAAEDYQLRYFGAAQFQFVMSADAPRAKRDLTFRMMMEANLGVFKALKNVEMH